MSEIIPVAFAARWSMPVNIVQQARVKRITGPGEAIRHMRDCFGDTSGPLYSKAVNVCFAALRCETDPDTARSVFLVAYQDHLDRLQLSR